MIAGDSRRAGQLGALALAALAIGACKQQGAGDVQARWAGGQRYTFDVRSTTKVVFGGAPAPYEVQLTARAQVSVAEKSGSRVVLFVGMPDLTMTDGAASPGAGAAKIADELRNAGCFAVLVEGRLTELRFPRDLSAGAATTCRLLAAALQTSEAAGGASRYSVEEYDTTGRHLVEYTCTAATRTCEKTKAKYLALIGASATQRGDLAGLVPRVVRSAGRFQRSADDEGLESVTIDDELLFDGAQSRMHSWTNLSLRRVGTTADRAGEWRAKGENLVSIAAGQAVAASASVEQLDQARLGGLTFRRALDLLESEASTGPKGAEAQVAARTKLFSALVASLRQEPGAVEQAANLIRTSGASWMVLIDALGSASSPKTEAALLALLEAADVPAERKQRVLQALARTPRPGQGAVAAMQAVLAKHPLDASALYALGTYSRRLREQGAPEASAKLGEYLVGRLRGVDGPVATVLVLRALANAGYGPAFDQVKPHLHSPDPYIRGAAVASLRAMQREDVEPVLAEYLIKDRSPEVQISAIDAARVRGPSDQLERALVAASNDPGPRVRHRVVELMIEWLPARPNLRQELARIASKDPEAKIRERANAAL